LGNHETTKPETTKEIKSLFRGFVFSWLHFVFVSLTYGVW